MKKIEDVKIGDKFIVTPEQNSFWAGEGVVSYKPTAGGKYLSLLMATGRRAGTVGGFLYSELKPTNAIVIGAPLPTFKPTFKVGDKVKILRKAKSHENDWGNSWVAQMDKEVGKIGEVTSINDQETKKDIAVRTDTHTWGYPVFALELQTGQYIIEFFNGAKWNRSGNRTKNNEERLSEKVYTSKSEAEAEANYQQGKSLSDYPYRVVELTAGTPVEVKAEPKPEPKRAFRVGDYVKVSGKKAYGWDGEGFVYGLYGGDGSQGTVGVQMSTGAHASFKGGFAIEAVSLVKASEQVPVAPAPKHLDYLGQEIKVGSFIVYPGRQGSSLYVNLGIVKRLTTSREKATLLVRGAKNTVSSTLTQIDRAVVVPRESVPVATRTRLEA